MASRTFPPGEWQKLEDPERLKWLPPAEALSYLDPRPGMVVADIGAGTGYFAIPLALAVAPQGKVLAVDSQPEMLAKFRAKLAALVVGPRNIDLIEGDAARTGLPDACCDLVLLANVWHELTDHAAALKEAGRILRRNGRLAILDWRPDVGRPPGPPLDHRIAPDDVASELRRGGWSVRRTGRVGDYSYILAAGRVPA